MTDPIERLLHALDEAFDHPAWHGPNLWGALQRVDAEEAAWRPAPDRHCIWELALHTAYWKHTVRRRIAGGPRGAFPRKPSNFPAVPALPDEEAWRADLALLRDTHRRLREAVRDFPPEALEHRARASKYTNETQMAGLAAHDVYHAGQIQLLKRLYRSRADD